MPAYFKHLSEKGLEKETGGQLRELQRTLAFSCLGTQPGSQAGQACWGSPALALPGPFIVAVNQLIDLSFMEALWFIILLTLFQG